MALRIATLCHIRIVSWPLVTRSHFRGVPQIIGPNRSGRASRERVEHTDFPGQGLYGD